MRKADYFKPTVMKDISGCTTFVGEDIQDFERLRDTQKATKNSLQV